MYERQYDSATACYYEGVKRTIAMCALLVACDQGAKPEPPKATTKIVEEVKEPTGFSDPVALMPANADAVVRLDIAALRRTSWWPPVASRAWAEVAPELANCDYDALGNIASVTAGLSQVAEGQTDAVVVVHGIDRDKMQKCLAGKNAPYAFVDVKTMVIMRAKVEAQAKLETALRGGTPLRQNASYTAIEKLVPRDAHVTMVMAPGSKMLERSNQVGMKLQYAYASARVDQRLDVDMTLAFNTAVEATQVSTLMKQQFAGLKSLFDKLDARVVDKTAQLHFGMTEAQATQMTSMLGALGTRN